MEMNGNGLQDKVPLASCERPGDKSNMTDVAPVWDDRCTMWTKKLVLQTSLEGLHVEM